MTAHLAYTVHRLTKRVPLKISRGTSTHSILFHVRWSEGGVEGWGETVPFAIDDRPQTVEVVTAALDQAIRILADASGWERVDIEARLRASGIPSAVVAGINLALYDWWGKTLGQPVWRLWGLARKPGPLTSVTIGIGTPDEAVRRLRQWQEVGDIRAYKVKLGSPEGEAADRAMFAALQEAFPRDARVSVDANGGWSLQTATAMSRWLANFGIDHLEQPLPRGAEADLPALRRASPLPIMVDESCKTPQELAALAASIDGINIKLMKCGGLDGALQLIHTARAHGLKVLVGCYGHSTLANTAAAHLGGLVDYLDLDSHLNLVDDPFRGAVLREGRLELSTAPGFGVDYVHLPPAA